MLCCRNQIQLSSVLYSISTYVRFCVPLLDLETIWSEVLSLIIDFYNNNKTKQVSCKGMNNLFHTCIVLVSLCIKWISFACSVCITSTVAIFSPRWWTSPSHCLNRQGVSFNNTKDGTFGDIYRVAGIWGSPKYRYQSKPPRRCKNSSFFLDIGTSKHYGTSRSVTETGC